MIRKMAAFPFAAPLSTSSSKGNAKKERASRSSLTDSDCADAGRHTSLTAMHAATRRKTRYEFKYVTTRSC